MKRKIVKRLLVLMLLLAGVAYGDTYKVLRVVDGDTVDILFDKETNSVKRIRLAYLDTMESMKNTRAKKLALDCNLNIEDIITVGKLAKERLKTLIENKDVNIVFMGLDVRGLRTVGFITTLDNVDVSEYMIINGYGLPYLHYVPKELKEKYKNMLIINPFLDNECIKKFEK